MEYIITHITKEETTNKQLNVLPMITLTIINLIFQIIKFLSRCITIWIQY